MLFETSDANILINESETVECIFKRRGKHINPEVVEVRRSSQEVELKAASELVPGKYYHCIDREDGSHSIEKCSITMGYHYPFLGSFDIWSAFECSSAFNKWRIFGPISPPSFSVIKDIEM